MSYEERYIVLNLLLFPKADIHQCGFDEIAANFLFHIELHPLLLETVKEKLEAG